jgi:Amt family ammonium transporter
VVIGPRSGYPATASRPHNVPFVLMGAGLLWFGWFGFNAGSALSAGGLAVIAFATTHVSAAVAGLAWTLIEWAHRGKPTLVGAATGAVAGLVAITPAAGYVTVPSALVIGLGAALFCYLGVTVLKPRLGYDDSLDVFGVHGVGGIWGAVATGLFATTAVNPAGADGLLYGNAGLLAAQLAGILAAAGLAGSVTFLSLKLIGLVLPLRVSEVEEAVGLDLALHGEEAYGSEPGEGAGQPEAGWVPAGGTTVAD